MKFILMLPLVLPLYSSGQSSYKIDKNGHASFFSYALIEDIEAKNNQVTAIMDMNSLKVAVSMLMTSFQFKSSLMQEHFNENYVESEKFPKSTFTGTLDHAPDYTVKSKQTIGVKGELALHGVTKPINTKVVFVISEKEMMAETVFNIVLEDYKIRIPKLMFNKIAEEVEVNAKFKFEL